jgi:hypothetical protein
MARRIDEFYFLLIVLAIVVIPIIVDALMKG